MENYRKKNVQPMRPYVVGEDLTGISVNKEDTPELGGMIAVNPKNTEDKWYVAKKFFEENYELDKPSISVEELERIIREFIPHRDNQYIKPLTLAIHKAMEGK